MSLSGNTEKINELISKINALPEAGGGGAGASGSCTVRIYSQGYEVSLHGYSLVKSSGEPDAYSYNAWPGYDFDQTFADVQCGSVLTMLAYSSWAPSASVTGNAELITSNPEYGFFAFHITAGNGETVTIKFTSDY